MAVSENSFKLECKTLVGATHFVEATGSMTVAELKNAVAMKAEVTAESIRIMKSKKFLKDDTKQLADYDILDAQKLKVIIRMKKAVLPEQPVVQIHGSARSVCLSTDNRYTACGTYSGELYIIDTKSGEIIFEEKNAHGSGAIRRCQFTRNANMLVTGGADQCAKLWHFDGTRLSEQQRLVMREDGGSAPLWAAWFSHCENYVVCAADGYDTIKIFEVDTGNLYKSFQHNQNAVKCCGLTKDFKYVAGGTQRGHLRVWEVENGNCQLDIAAHNTEMWNLVISNDDEHVYTLGIHGPCKKWSILTGENLNTWNVDSYDFKLLREEQFFAYMAGGNLQICNVDSEDVVNDQVVICKTGHADQICVSNLKNAFIVATTDGNVNFIKIPEEKFYGEL